MRADDVRADDVRAAELREDPDECEPSERERFGAKLGGGTCSEEELFSLLLLGILAMSTSSLNVLY